MIILVRCCFNIKLLPWIRKILPFLCNKSSWSLCFPNMQEVSLLCSIINIFIPCVAAVSFVSKPYKSSPSAVPWCCSHTGAWGALAWLSVPFPLRVTDSLLLLVLHASCKGTWVCVHKLLVLLLCSHQEGTAILHTPMATSRSYT